MNEQVAALVRAATEVLRADGRDDAARAIALCASQPPVSIPMVLVVGETGRGKSTLVDALLGHSPARDAHGPTVVPIEYRAGDAGARVNVGATARDVSIDAARRLAAEGVDERGDVVGKIVVTLPHPLLREMTLVDTPGVGGLSEGSASLTLQAVAAADAAVFVVDAAAPLRASEIDFLRRATSRIDTVVFVMTKTDAHRGWRTIATDDQAIVAQHAPRFAQCPWVAVSSTVCLEGIDDPVDAEALRDESGIAELDAVLSARVADRAGVLRDANIVRAVTVELATLERTLARGVPADGDVERTAEQLRTERTRLQALGQDRSAWMQMLDMEFRKLQPERTQLVNRGVIEIRRRYEAKLKELKPSEEQALPGALIADLTALTGEVNEATMARLDRIVRSILHDLDDPGILEAQIRELGAITLDDELQTIEMYHRGLSHLDRLSIFSTFSTGRSMASFASGSGLGITASALIAPPVGLALGLGLGGFFAFQSFRNRRREIFAADFTSWMRDQIAYVQQTLSATFSSDSVELQAAIRRYLRDILGAREAEINAAIAAADAAHKQAASERASEAARLQERATTVRALRQRAHQALVALDATPATTGAAP